MSDCFDHAGNAGAVPLGMHSTCHTADLREGKVKKGGVNPPPTNRRPGPPAAQRPASREDLIRELAELRRKYAELASHHNASCRCLNIY